MHDYQEHAVWPTIVLTLSWVWEVCKSWQWGKNKTSLLKLLHSQWMDVEEHIMTQHSFMENHNKDAASIFLLLIVYLTEANLQPCMYRVALYAYLVTKVIL